MKICYVFPGLASYGRTTNGILVQARTWASGLQRIGVDVELFDVWKGYDFSKCDLVHAFSYCAKQEDIFRALKNSCDAKLAISPIIDTNRSAWITRLASRFHFPKFHLYSVIGSLSASVPFVDAWFVRSDYEGAHVRSGLGVDPEKIFKVMLPTRMEPGDGIYDKEPFCLLTCFLPAPRKNVMRLIDAAIKFGFKLVLAGEKTSPKAYSEMLRKIDGHENIVVVGRQSEDELLSLYRRARVFALPSLMEGVGLVALEAAANGCDVVLTNRGGPKEYFDGKALLVDPMSVDQIGNAVMDFMHGKTFQPQLQYHVTSNFSVGKSALSLKAAYERIIG